MIETLKKHNGNVAATAKELGINRTSLLKRLGQMKLDDLRNTDPLIVTGYSTLRKIENDPTGKILEWTKTKPSIENQLKAVRIAVDELVNGIEPAKVIDPPLFKTREELSTLYTLTDCHIGMYAWHEETGDDWDLTIAENLFGKSIKHLANLTTARTGLLNLQGDFLHYSGKDPKTEQHGHVLDSDSRQTKMIRTAVRIIRTAIDTLLAKHECVIVSIVEGNHDESATPYLSTMLDVLYSDNERLTVMSDTRPYKVYVHGKCFIGITHGHLVNVNKLPEVFSEMFSKEFGETKYRFIHCGHRHHEHFIETNSFKIQQHSTLAAKDAYAARGGWLSQRMIRSVTYHAEFGEIKTNCVTPEIINQFYKY